MIPRRPNKSYRYTTRLWVVGGLLAFLCLALIGRMLQLTLFERAFLQAEGDARAARTIDITAYRGAITDRNGQPLAISVPVKSIWINPQTFSIDDPRFNQLATLLGERSQDIKKQLVNTNHREFVYLKRQLDPALADKIIALGIPGLYEQPEFRRFYPEAEVAAPLVGFTNVDDVGQEGIELQYNKALQGSPGMERVERDLYGHVVALQGVIKPAVSGQQIELSIDNRLQYMAYQALQQAITANKAEAGSMVIVNVKTGEILAMANYPSFNPNNRPLVRTDYFRNQAATDVFEPGSTMKPFAVANALRNGKVTPTTKVDTNPGYFYLDGKRVEDENNLGVIDVTGVLQHSSNVGVTKLTLTTPPSSLYELMHSIGLGQRTNLDYPGESPGELVNRDKWAPFTLATMSFGYGLNVTALQLAQAYSMLASDGVKKPLSLTKLPADTQVQGTDILSPTITQSIVTMLESVVQKGGTAYKARIPGYIVSGKTGTVRIVGPHGYEAHHHVGIFVGIVPVTHPVFVAVTVIKNPQNGVYFGGDVSGPVFSSVMSQALMLYDVKPDDPASLPNAEPGATPSNNTNVPPSQAPQSTTKDGKPPAQRQAELHTQLQQQAKSQIASQAQTKETQATSQTLLQQQAKSQIASQVAASNIQAEVQPSMITTQADTKAGTA